MMRRRTDTSMCRLPSCSIMTRCVQWINNARDDGADETDSNRLVAAVVELHGLLSQL